MVHMKINIRDNFYPMNYIPDDYTIILITTDKLTKEDGNKWREIQLQRENVKTHDKLLIPKEGAVSFIKHKGIIIGCGCLKRISLDVAESQHIMILKEHRRKGLFKSLMGVHWRYCYLEGITWINLSPVVQTNFWIRKGAIEGWA